MTVILKADKKCREEKITLINSGNNKSLSLTILTTAYNMKAAFTTVKFILVSTMYTIYKDSKNKPNCFVQTAKVPLPDP